MFDKIKVAIVDNHQIYRSVLEEYLSQLGLKIVFTCNLDIAQLKMNILVDRPRVIIIGCYIEWRQSLEAFKKLKKRHPSIKLIANVMFRITDEERAQLAKFADGIVIKTSPKTSYIIEVIRKVCELS